MFALLNYSIAIALGAAALYILLRYKREEAEAYAVCVVKPPQKAVMPRRDDG